MWQPSGGGEENSLAGALLVIPGPFELQYAAPATSLAVAGVIASGILLVTWGFFTCQPA